MEGGREGGRSDWRHLPPLFTAGVFPPPSFFLLPPQPSPTTVVPFFQNSPPPPSLLQRWRLYQNETFREGEKAEGRGDLRT